ncbi:sensor histidine kinase [Pollutimonas bauzanensis]|uniref:histidine kinase n=1 Tax=Pollutimonas bauzanensis TaxID=658167 RepID=A0A1M5MIG9_9BURK|nr:sensor histidine kinase [Pollutimonas bauzanensis]SHG76523.1 two-component system, OmpR family, sensor histidine kinase TctE [Pollutimonas bauzanensis]
MSRNPPTPPDTDGRPAPRLPFLWRFRRKKNNRALLNKIMIWMFGPLFLLWTIGLVITYFIAQNIANAPYDRTLADHLRMLKHEIQQQKITEGIQLSASAITILQGDPTHLIHWEIQDANANSIGGNASIPLPDNWSYEEDVIRFRNETLNGLSVRVAYIWGGRDMNGLDFLTVVAQSNEMRATLQQEILTGMLTPQLIVLPLAALLAGLGLTQGLEPLSLLQERIRARRTNDMSPISDDLAPAEIVPLVAAMNSLLTRMAATNETQRRFVANAAHQLKTPLAGMRTQAELALRERSPEKMNASLEQLVRGSERATRLVNQLLTLARAESADDATRPLSDIVELNEMAEKATSAWVDTALKKNIDLGFECALAPMHVLGNSLMLAELLGNLIDNALLYTPAQGWVTVRVGGDALSTYLEVEDSGPGIAAADRERIFDRFFRVMGTNVDGSGLGLSIVKEIAEQHRASVNFMPPGHRHGVPGGTCLRVTFARLKDVSPPVDWTAPGGAHHPPEQA